VPLVIHDKNKDTCLSPTKHPILWNTIYGTIIMNMQTTIEKKLNEALKPEVLDIFNESSMHSGPATESHFKVVAVSEAFEGKMLIARHRMINAALVKELNSIHALSLHTMTPDEYFEKAGKVSDSPECAGGGK